MSRLRKYPINMLRDKGCDNVYIVTVEQISPKKLDRDIKEGLSGNEDITIVDYKNKPNILDFSYDQSIINYNEGYETTRNILSKKLK